MAARLPESAGVRSTLTREYVLASALADEYEPFGVLLKDAGGVQAAAMMRFGEAELPASLGYRLAYRPRCLALVAQRGIVGADDPSAAAALIDALRAAMEAERVDGVALGARRGQRCLGVTARRRSRSKRRRGRRTHAGCCLVWRRRSASDGVGAGQTVDPKQ